MNIAISLVMAYLLGSIPFAYLISRTKGVDIRRVGDGNVGAFNVFRHVGLGAGLATLALDIGKGATAIMVAKTLHIPEIAVCLTGVAAVAGHNCPVFLRFKGGRGEATIVGILFAAVPWQIMVTFIPGIIVLFVTRNSIWVGMALFIPLPAICLVTNRLLGQPSLTIVVYTVFLPCLAGFTHWLTTRRLPPGARKEAGTFWVANKRNR
jgi:glycerol-3-phosphate acyltransferase PlsY